MSEERDRTDRAIADGLAWRDERDRTRSLGLPDPPKPPSLIDTDAREWVDNHLGYKLQRAAVNPARVDAAIAEHTAKKASTNGHGPDNGHAFALAKFAARLRTPEQIKAMPEPDWLIEDYLVANTLAVVWGKWGSGKSLLELAMAAHIGAGS
jgi:hypothetical protein